MLSYGCVEFIHVKKVVREMDKNFRGLCIVILISVLATFLYVDSRLLYLHEYLATLAYILIIMSLFFLIVYHFDLSRKKKK